MFSVSSIIASALALLTGLVPGAAEAEPAPVDNVDLAASETSVEQQAEKITRERALEIAQEHAGVTADRVVHVDDLEREDDDRREIWEIEFLADGSEHEFDIDAYSGEVLAYEKDREHRDDESRRASAPAERISGDRALQIAVDHAGAGTASYVDDLELDSDDGVLSWEVEFSAGGMEYEYDIDAYSGAILDHEIDD